MPEQLTFTEDEVGRVRAFINFVFEHAQWDLPTKEIFELTKLYQDMAKHVKICEDHIMELKAVYERPKEESVDEQ